MTTAEAPTSAVEAIRQLILSGVYAAGARLGEVELADRLEVSRTPVREALRVLAAEGLVELVPHKGARVVAFSDEELEHIFALRAQVEGTAARQAARTITDAELDQLQRLAEAIARHALPGPDRDLDRVYALNAEFHAGLAAATRSTVLAQTIDGLFHTVAALRTLSGFDEDAVRRSVAHHLEIVAALRAGDGRWAESVMRSHLYSARAATLGPLPTASRSTDRPSTDRPSTDHAPTEDQ